MQEKIIEALKGLSKDYYGANYYDDREADAAAEVVMNQSPFRYYGNYHGMKALKVEEKARNIFGTKYAHCVNSGTGALSCALHALDVTIGDEVLIPGYFWCAVANAVIQRGAYPVLCEVDESLNIDINDLKKKITEKTKCLIMIHMDGSPAEIDSLVKICKEHNISILEDFSQCIGGSYKGKKIGSFGDVSIASLQVNKLITAGEGGLILTKSEEIYQKVMARSDCGLAREENENNEKYITIGEGRRFGEIGAAIIDIQLDRIPYMLEQLRKNKAYIKNMLGDISPIQYRKHAFEEGEIATALILQFPSKKDVNEIMDLYQKEFEHDELHLYRLENFGCHIYYNCQNLIRKTEALPGGWPWNLATEEYSYEKGTLKKADGLFERTIAMKLPGNISEEQVRAIGIALRELISKYMEKWRYKKDE